MARYYFDVFDGDDAYEDEVGIELTSVESARRAAVGVAQDLAGENVPEEGQYSLMVQVRDESRKVVVRVTLSFSVETP